MAMSGFWSVVVIVLAMTTLGISFFLLCWAPYVVIPTREDGTTTHTWAHGVLREGVRPLPLWWRTMSFGLYAVAVVYLVLYPGLGNFPGLLGWTSEHRLEQQEGIERVRLGTLAERLEGRTLAEMAADPELVRAGRTLYGDNCAACHGQKGTGIQALGAPNLIDGDWLHGGSDDAILVSILDGRHGLMPPQAAALDPARITDLAHYVLSLSGPPIDPVRAQLGKASFGTCAACHGATGQGNPALGAPNLTDSIWLHGGALADIERAIRQGVSGTMPAWRARLAVEDAQLIGAWLRASGPPIPAP